MAVSNTSGTNAIIEGSKQYPYPSHVNPTGFVSVKLSGKPNYQAWQEQLMCLVESHDMFGFIDGTFKKPRDKIDDHDEDDDDGKDDADDDDDNDNDNDNDNDIDINNNNNNNNKDDNNNNNSNNNICETADFEAKCREWKRSDALVKGWIFGSLTDNVMGTVVGLKSAKEVWDKLKKNYAASPATTTTAVGKDYAVYEPLCRAIQTGDWMNTQKILKENKDALTAKLNDYEETTLHIAIGNPDNIQILQNLLELIDSDSLPNLLNADSENALHYAARLDNIEAAKKLVEKNPILLFTVDDFREDVYNRLPIMSAIINSNKTTFRYLLQVCEDHITLSQKEGLHNPFEGEHGVLLLNVTISSGILDVAYELLKKNPKLATTIVDDEAPLYYIAKKWDVYRSAKRYNFYQRFVYSYVPPENYSFNNKHNKQDIENQGTNIANLDTNLPVENQETNMVNLVRHGSTNYIYQALNWIYDKFWKVALLNVKHIKQLHDDKVKHNTALKILKFICDEVAKLKSEHNEHYEEAFIVAMENDTPEVLTFPQSIWTSDDINDYTLSQLSIIYRCENAYNFFVNEVTQDKYLHKLRLDDNDNNLLHLAGRLAPTHKLNMVTGAALQMQRELQWFEEVKNIMRHASGIEEKNDKQQTPDMVFRKEHEDLRQKGEEWMKKTADSYTITAALIITIVFAAAITVPGGNQGDTGKPVFETRPSFFIFVVADAISMFTSTTSLLLFLSILTARYAVEDFLYKLPKRLILGLVMLFISVTTMVIAFSASLYIMFGQGKLWILIPIVALTFLPIVSFVTLQLPLLYDLISSTYGHGMFHKQSELNSLRYKPKPMALKS